MCHLPMEIINTYFGPRRIFLYHLTGALDLAAGIVRGLKLKRFFEGGHRIWAIKN